MAEDNLSNFKLTEFYYVTHLAQLQCTQGSIFGSLNVSQPNRPTITNRASANVRDTVPLQNLTPFGVCAVTQKPCNMPSLRGWDQHSPNVYVNDGLALLDCSHNQCGLGGRISVLQCGQPVPFVSTGLVDAKKMRYEARMKLLRAAQAQLATEELPEPGKNEVKADATRVAPGPGLAALRQRQAAHQGMLRAATERLARNNTAVERAKLSDDSYENGIATDAAGNRRIVRTHPPPEGWKVTRVTEDKKSGFMAVEYESNFEQPPRKVLVFRGTDKTQLNDWETDFQQGIGMDTAQYREAEDTALAMQKRNPKGFDIAGHSLGGGEASLASLITGQPAYTFNSSGLHKNTMRRAKVNPDAVPYNQRKIQAYYASGDPLSAPQDHSNIVKGVLAPISSSLPIIGPVVTPIIVNPESLPEAVGIRHEFGDAGFHPVPPLVDQIEEQKEEDIETIRRLMPIDF